MARVIVKKLRTKSSERSRASVVEKTYTDAEGRKRTVRKLDANSKTFGGDLRFVFKKNVEQIRRENKRLLGCTDYLPRNISSR